MKSNVMYCMYVESISLHVCVCNIWTDVKLLLYFLFHILQGHRGPGGSVTNVDTSPVPVKTYPQDFGGAPGRI